MEAAAYDEFRRLEKVHFWFRGRRAIFFDLIRRSMPSNGEAGASRQVLEIGCGEGGMLPSLREHGTVHGIDISHDSTRYCHSRGDAHMVTGNGYHLPYADGAFDLVGLFDTIEHIPDDVGVLREVRRVLKPGGQVFISVPAYQMLYSDNDRVAHHQRRYTRTRLRKALREAELTPTKLTYFNTFLFPMILPTVLWFKFKEGVLKRRKTHTNLGHKVSKPINETFAWIMSSERHLLRHVSFPFGHSLIGMAQRPEPSAE